MTNDDIDLFLDTLKVSKKRIFELLEDDNDVALGSMIYEAWLNFKNLEKTND